MQQLDRPRRVRIERRAAVPEHVAREPDRGQRRAQLVRDVGDEALLHGGELGEPGDLASQALRHAVERPGERREHVVAAHRQPHVELPRRQSAAGRRGDLDRADHESHHEEGDGADQRDQREPGAGERELDRRERLLGVGDVIDEEELVADALDLEHRSRDDRRRERAVGAREPGRLRVDPALGVRGERVPQLGRDHLVEDPVEAARVRLGGRAGHVLTRGEDQRVGGRVGGRRRGAQDDPDALVERGVRLHVALVDGGVEAALRRDRRALAQRHQLGAARVEQALADAELDRDPDGRGRDRRQHDRHRDGPQRQRGAPCADQAAPPQPRVDPAGHRAALSSPRGSRPRGRS